MLSIYSNHVWSWLAMTMSMMGVQIMDDDHVGVKVAHKFTLDIIRSTFFSHFLLSHLLTPTQCSWYPSIASPDKFFRIHPHVWLLDQPLVNIPIPIRKNDIGCPISQSPVHQPQPKALP